MWSILTNRVVQVNVQPPYSRNWKVVNCLGQNPLNGKGSDRVFFSGTWSVVAQKGSWDNLNFWWFLWFPPIFFGSPPKNLQYLIIDNILQNGLISSQIEPIWYVSISKYLSNQLDFEQNRADLRDIYKQISLKSARFRGEFEPLMDI